MNDQSINPVNGARPAGAAAVSILADVARALQDPAAAADAWGALVHTAPEQRRPLDCAEHRRAFDVRLSTQDGVLLAATAFEPITPARAVALIAPATGVPRGFYRAFAHWLSESGYAVLTLDYRGIADSHLPESTRPSASMVDWMQRDLAAGLTAARRRAANGARDLAVLWVGHSLGGHALAQFPHVDQIDAAIGIAAQLPSYGTWPRWYQRAAARFFFCAWVPGCVRVFGDLPGWALGSGQSIPAAAALDWSRWGQMPGYFTADPQIEVTASRWRGIAHLWWVEDDWIFGPRGAVEALHSALNASAGSAHLFDVAPRDVGVRRLGHFGPFRRSAAAKLWPRMLGEIERAVPRLQAHRPDRVD